jgi:hypothetical protein
MVFMGQSVGEPMMFKRSVFAALLTSCVALSGVPAVAAQAVPQQEPWSAIQTYCVGCHNEKTRAGGRAFDTMSPDKVAQNAEVFEAAIRKLRGGQMPPPGAKRPDVQTVSKLVSWLENQIDSAVVAAPAGRVSLRRLNRREYTNVIRDLIAVNIDAKKLLPLDDVKGHFDNNAAGLQVSPSFVDQYVSAAREISAQAVGNAEAPPVTTTYGKAENMVISLPPSAEPGTGRQQHRLEGLPFGTRGGMVVEHNFPVDGEYELTIGDMALAREVPKMEFENTVIALLDGKEFYRTNIGGEADHKAIDQRLDPAVEEINGRLRKIHFHAAAGQHKVAITFLHRSFAESDERIRTSALEGGQERIQAVHALQIRGPLVVTGMSASASRKKIFICQPANAADETACARKIVSNLAQRAFRRPATDDDVNSLMGFYRSGRAIGDFDRGVRDAVSAILASPHFLYRAESGDSAGNVRTLSDLELASRLSFFLWSSIPDEELLNLAIQSRLGQPDVLTKQVRRMLADSRSKSLIDDFAFQWLDVAKLDEITPDSRQFPQASGLLDQRGLMKEELRLFIDSILRGNRNVTELLTADYTFLNERLAEHYGIETVKGDNFRRVTMENTARYGLLGKGAILMLTAYPNRTSPVTRGAWILDRLLGTPPSPPPPNVPTLPENRAVRPRQCARGWSSTAQIRHVWPVTPSWILWDWRLKTSIRWVSSALMTRKHSVCWTPPELCPTAPRSRDLTIFAVPWRQSRISLLRHSRRTCWPLHWVGVSTTTTCPPCAVSCATRRRTITASSRSSWELFQVMLSGSGMHPIEA